MEGEGEVETHHCACARVWQGRVSTFSLADSDNPEVRPFVLSDVQLSGTRIGAGAYGSVEKVYAVRLKRSITSSKIMPRFLMTISSSRRPSL